MLSLRLWVLMALLCSVFWGVFYCLPIVPVNAR